MEADPKYWFPAKRYGWGWGLPLTWQGWLVLAAFVALIAAGAFLIRPREHLTAFIVYVVVLVALFTGVCWLKGEPPRWRWGND
jgi:drug/metabolite transporter (DMT)-like permease